MKDRIGRAMIEAAEKAGILTRKTKIIEPTSGNTGIALAFVAAAKGYDLTLDHAGIDELRAPRDVAGAWSKTCAHARQRRHERRDRQGPGTRCFDAEQLDAAAVRNPANPEIHEKTTGKEIWEDTGGRVDMIVAGVGTGGTITGVTSYIRAKNPQFRAIAVEPADSPVISGGKPGPHKIQGIGAGLFQRISMSRCFTAWKRLQMRKPLPGPAVWLVKKEFWAGSALGPMWRQRFAWPPEA